jgi:hypothetical protein
VCITASDMRAYGPPPPSPPPPAAYEPDATLRLHIRCIVLDFLDRILSPVAIWRPFGCPDSADSVPRLLSRSEKEAISTQAFFVLYWILVNFRGAAETVTLCIIDYYFGEEDLLRALADRLWAASKIPAPPWEYMVNHIRVFSRFTYLSFGRGTRLRPSRLDCHKCGSTYDNANQRLLAVCPHLASRPTYLANPFGGFGGRFTTQHRGYPYLFCHPSTNGEDDPTDVQTPYHGIPGTVEWGGVDLWTQLYASRVEWETRGSRLARQKPEASTCMAPRHPGPDANGRLIWEYDLKVALASVRLPDDQDKHCKWLDVTGFAPSPDKMPPGMRVWSSAVDFVELESEKDWDRYDPAGPLHKYLRGFKSTSPDSPEHSNTPVSPPQLRRHGLKQGQRKAYEHEQDGTEYGRRCGARDCEDKNQLCCPCHRIQVQTMEVYFAIKYREEDTKLHPARSTATTGDMVAPGDLPLLCGLDLAEEAAWGFQHARVDQWLCDFDTSYTKLRGMDSALGLPNDSTVERMRLKMKEALTRTMVIPELVRPSKVRAMASDFRADEPYYVGRSFHSSRGAMAPLFSAANDLSLVLTRHRSAREDGISKSCREIYRHFVAHSSWLHWSAGSKPNVSRDMTVMGSPWRQGVNPWRFGRSGTMDLHARLPDGQRRERVFVEERGALLPDGSLLGPYGLGAEEVRAQYLWRVDFGLEYSGFIPPSDLLQDGDVTNGAGSLELANHPDIKSSNNCSYISSGRGLNPLIVCRKQAAVQARKAGVGEDMLNLHAESVEWLGVLDDVAFANPASWKGPEVLLDRFHHNDWREAGQAAHELRRKYLVRGSGSATVMPIPTDAELRKGYVYTPPPVPPSRRWRTGKALAPQPIHRW